MVSVPASPAHSDVSSVSPTASDMAKISFSIRRSRRRSRASSITGPGDGPEDDWGFTPEAQEKAVAQFRELLVKEGVREHQEYHTLLRFLRARDYDLQKANLMYTGHLKWRAEHNVDTVMKDFHFTEREHYLQVYPQGYYMTDKIGRPISIQHLGKIDPKRIKEITTEERMIMYHVQEYERFLKHIAPVCSRMQGRHIDKMFVIMDVKGVTLRTLSGDVRKVIARITSVMQDHYPETLAKTCIINAPFYFQAVWSLVKPLLQPRTVNKVTLLGTKYMDELTKFVDVESIPEYMGGKCRNTLLDDPGPWNDPQVMSMLGMVTEENNEDAAEHLHMNEIDAADSPSAMRALAHQVIPPVLSRTGPNQSPRTPDRLSVKTPAKSVKEGSEASDLDIRLPSIPHGLHGNPAFEPGNNMPQQQQSPASLLRRIQTLEETMKDKGLPIPHKELPALPPKSLLARVEMLESAMATMCQLQEARLQEEREFRQAQEADVPQAAKGCCCIM